jgi:hypothetical protein
MDQNKETARFVYEQMLSIKDALLASNREQLTKGGLTEEQIEAGCENLRLLLESQIEKLRLEVDAS